MSESEVQVVVTGTTWMGAGIGSIESALERLFREATQDVAATAFSITSGADLLFAWMETALARGVRVRLAINNVDGQPQDTIARLRLLSRIYSHFHLFDFRPDPDADLHAKVVVADARLALIGSSNFSRRGLLMNHEIAAFIEGPAAAAAAGVLDRLFASRHVIEISRA